MNAFDMLDDSFPHGTPAGYTLGCHGNHCAGDGLSCADAMIRYRGDWAFRKLVEQGAAVAELVAYVAAERAAFAEKKPKKVKVAPQPKKKREPVRDVDRPRSGIQSRPWTHTELTTLRELHAEGKHDGQIGEAIGRPLQSVWAKRKALGLPANGRTHVFKHGTVTGYQQGCHNGDCPVTPSCGDVGRAYHRARQKNRRPKPNPARIAARTEREANVRDLHTQGLSDVRIAATLGVNKSTARDIRHRLGLPVVGKSGRPKREAS